MRLRDLLNKLSWSQADLGNYSGVSSATVRRVLLGEPISRRSSQKILNTLSEALRLPLEASDINTMKISEMERKDKQTKPRPDC